MGNCNKSPTQIQSVGIRLMDNDEIKVYLQSVQPLSRSLKRTFSISFASSQAKPTNALLHTAALHGHVGMLILLHAKYSICPTATEFESLFQFCASPNTGKSASQNVRINDKKKIEIYLTHIQTLQKNASDQETEHCTTAPDDVFEMMLLTAWRWSDDDWLEDLLAQEEMDSPQVFSLLKEALHDGDELMVSELISRGASLELQRPKRGCSSTSENEDDYYWETALHHAVASLPLKSNGMAGALVRRLMASGRCFITRRDAENHTALSLAVQEGHLQVIRILINEYDADLDFDVSPGLSFRQWSTHSNSPGRTKEGMEESTDTTNTEEISLVMKALFVLRKGEEEVVIGGGQKENSYVFGDGGGKEDEKGPRGKGEGGKKELDQKSSSL